MKDKYLAMLEHSHTTYKEFLGDKESTRLEYLSGEIFNFTTYDSDVAELFARKALDVCEAINKRKTFEYQQDTGGYHWFLIMINMPFFTDRLNWGTSVRGAWWDHKEFKLGSCGLFEGEKQVLEMTFTRDEWMAFIEALVEFGETEEPSDENKG